MRIIQESHFAYRRYITPDDRMIRVRIPAGDGNFSRHRVQTSSGAHPTSYPMGARGGRGLKLTTHRHIVPRSRMRGAIRLLPQYVLMAWCLVKHRDNFTFTMNMAFPLLPIMLH
jgi:hypothetical protein